MKVKAIIAGMVMFLMIAINTNPLNAQEKTYLEESGEAQDSAAMSDIFYGLEEQNQGPSTILIVGIVAVVVAGGAVFYFLRKKKK
jgi:LPXTG-motif cell wall-anchored protein